MRPLYLLCALAPLLVSSVSAEETNPLATTFEGFANLSGGVASYEHEDDRAESSIFGEGRALALFDVAPGLLVGPRITYRGVTSTVADDDVRVGEASVIALGSWGRFEIGDRRGLPDVLTGYAPNNYQFVSAEYGPASGQSLDPDGGLQTSLLEAELGSQISALTSLGITSSFFSDESTKAIYVSPKRHGLLGGISYAPRVKDTAGNLQDLIQIGLTWEHYWDQNVLRLGGTAAYANGQRSDSGALRTSDLHSIGFGASLTIDDALTLAISTSFNGDGGLTEREQGFASDSYGYAASANYNRGPWTVGTFVQRARSEGDTDVRGGDRLSAAQFGVSYRANTHVRHFATIYLYGFDDEGGAGRLGAADGTVLLVGTRFSF